MTPSFAYVYEAFTQDPKFERDLAKIETEIARLGIQGRTIRLALFRDIADGLQECLAAGVKNVIFIGDDNLVFQAIPFLVEKGLVGGFIPLRPSLLASVFGVPMGGDAVGIIAARVLAHLDIGIMNDRPFLTEAVALKTTSPLKIDGRYTARALQPGPVSIRNISVQADAEAGSSFAEDGQLEAIIQTKVETSAYLGLWKQTQLQETHLFFEKAVMKSEEGIEFLVDGQRFTTKQAMFSLKPNALSFIVGPDRKV